MFVQLGNSLPTFPAIERATGYGQRRIRQTAERLGLEVKVAGQTQVISASDLELLVRELDRTETIRTPLSDIRA